MKILVDADACPVVAQTIELATRYSTAVILFCDAAHEMNREGADTVIVAKGADSADFALVNRAEAGDIVITQDYGLAAMALAKRACVLDQNGRSYTADNIDALLLSRHTARKIRQAGGRLRGPSKRVHAQDEAFAEALEHMLSRNRT